MTVKSIFIFNDEKKAVWPHFIYNAMEDKLNVQKLKKGLS